MTGLSKISVPVDLKGHTSNERFFTGDDGVVMLDFSKYDEDVYYEAAYGFSKSCNNCGEYIGLRYDPVTKLGSTNLEQCRYAGGFTTHTEVEFLSGKILVADAIPGNWVRAGDVDGSATYNSKLGQQQVIQMMAVRKTAFGPTGNQSLGLYKINDEHYQIIGPGYDLDNDKILLPDGLTEEDSVAGICTDLWAYSIVDWDEWLKAGNDPEALHWDETPVEIKPGRYLFSYHGHETGFEWDAAGPQVFADMTLVR